MAPMKIDFACVDIICIEGKVEAIATNLDLLLKME